jgi:alpha-amylase
MTVNPRFGSEDDLKALSKALHDRGMFFMVDVAINNVPSLNVHDALDPNALAADNSRWTKPEYFHEHCWIDYSNTTSVEQWYVNYPRAGICTDV